MSSSDQRSSRAADRNRLEAVVAWEQVRQAYNTAPFGIIATVINSLIVFWVMKPVMTGDVLFVWLTAVLVVTLVRMGMVVLFRRRARRAAANDWARVFLAGLALIGLMWGSIGLFSPASLAEQVFIVFVLGGMSAGAAASFSALRSSFLAFTVPAFAPVTVRFFLINDVFHHAMAVMLVLYGFLLWRISWRLFMDNRTSLLLRFENESMVERLQRTRKSLEKLSRTLLSEVQARRTAEEALRAHQGRLEKIVDERTAALVSTNAELRVQIEERKRIEQELRESRERLALAQKAGKVGVFDVDLISGRAFWTEELEVLFGLRPGAFEGEFAAWTRRVYPEDLPAIEEQLSKWKRERTGRVEFEYRAVRADGQVRWMTASAVISYLDGTAARMIGTTVDSTERKRLEEETMHMVHHDTLTGLPNRRLFMDFLTMEMAQARRNGRKFAILFLDLDRFKEINDSLGHDAGDELLKEVSRRVKNSIRESDTAARIGGDEFNIIVADIMHTEDVAFIVQKIMNAFEAPFAIAGSELRVTASVGISVYPDDSEEIGALLRWADVAMYHAKERGRNAFQFYNRDMNRLSADRIQFQNNLRETLARGELDVYYLPQREVKTGRLTAVEALVRWRHPTMGILEPKDFVPMAESSGMITAIDEWVLRTACGQLSVWINQVDSPLSVTVNVSSRFILQHDCLEKVSAALDKCGLPPGRLEIEITESVATEDIERTLLLAKELTRRGIGISIDDFGTGYSSLTTLKRLPIHRLKIDRSIIRDMGVDADHRAIIRAMTAMAHLMKLSVVAEGVETRDQMSFLSEVECDEVQGYFFNEPLPAEQFSRLIH